LCFEPRHDKCFTRLVGALVVTLASELWFPFALGAGFLLLHALVTHESLVELAQFWILVIAGFLLDQELGKQLSLFQQEVQAVFSRHLFVWEGWILLLGEHLRKLALLTLFFRQELFLELLFVFGLLLEAYLRADLGIVLLVTGVIAQRVCFGLGLSALLMAGRRSHLFVVF
jgi:hypothetical protein